jgi:predicted kinase
MAELRRAGKMTVRDTPLLVVMTGPPAAGKTTIARAVADRLGWPLVAKDPIKETLAEALDVRGRAASQRLGVATFDVLFHVLDELLRAGVSTVAEGNFGRAEPFARLPPARVLQVHVTAPPKTSRRGSPTVPAGTWCITTPRLPTRSASA